MKAKISGLQKLLSAKVVTPRDWKFEYYKAYRELQTLPDSIYKLKRQGEMLPTIYNFDWLKNKKKKFTIFIRNACKQISSVFNRAFWILLCMAVEII